MNIGQRVYVIEDDGAVHRLPQKVFWGFSQGETALPQFAGRTVLKAHAYYELENKKPKRILRLEATRMRVQADGLIDKGFEDDRIVLEVMHAFSPIGRRPLRIIRPEYRFAERRYKHLHPEVPGPALKSILSDLFEGQRAAS